jgi:transposase-like protein
MARPTIFSDDMIVIAEEYIAGGYKDDGKVIPSMVGLARKLKVHKSTLYEWMADKDHLLSDTLRDVSQAQEEELLNKGLSGQFNAAITKLALGNHGYSDKQETEHKGGVSIVASELDESI